MKIFIAALLVCAGPAGADFKPTPYAATELDAAKNTCMLNSSMKREPQMRHPELTSIKPDRWNAGYENCEQTWQDWKAQVKKGNPSIVFTDAP
jgi:hypothetical protein